MAQYKKKRAGGRPRSKKAMQAELKQDLIGIALLALGLFVAFCLWQVPAGGEENILGALGFRVYKLTAAKTHLPLPKRAAVNGFGPWLWS